MVIKKPSVAESLDKTNYIFDCLDTYYSLTSIDESPIFCLKGTVQRKLTGVKSGINQ
jgi:hypothetical protein